MANSDTDLLAIFKDEVSEYLTLMNNVLLRIETSSADSELLRELNRVAHSMKGAARAVGIKPVEAVAHTMEAVFDAALNGRIELSPDACDLIYDGLDMIELVMGGEVPAAGILETLLASLEVLAPTREAATPIPIRDSAPVELPAVPINQSAVDRDTTTQTLRLAEDSVRVTVRKLDQLMAEVSELLVARLQNEERLHEIEQMRRLHTRWRREWQGVRGAYIRLARRIQDEDSAFSVDLAVLFKFLESNQRYLADSHHQLGQLGQILGQDNLRLAMLSDQLQDDITRMRMVSFETLLGTFQRTVRDLARDTGKQVHFDVVGASVEFDKAVLDGLKDPIIHLLRNAVDHGIEPPDDRERRGKSPVGVVTLMIEQRGSEVIVQVADDGAGINVRAVLETAVVAGLLSEHDAEMLNEEDTRDLIFHPGLTTSAQITTISGRGIGMDAVRSQVERMRGGVSVSSQPGRGTRTSLIVPVSLTRIHCVLLWVGREHYAISSTVVARMMTVKRADVFTAENREMILVDQRPVLLVSLAGLLGVASERSTADLQVIVLLVADRQVAFEVDDLESERELVLKPLGKEIIGAEFVSGAALLGTGAVVIVLDANDLVRRATGSVMARVQNQLPAAVNVTEDKMRVLIVDDSITTRTLEKNILETAGFEVQVAIDGVQASRILKEFDFDVVVSDVEMPNMNGLELTQWIKHNPQTQHLPVILLTSLARPEQREAGLKAGADAYLVKSQFEQGELIQLIRTLV